MTHDASRPEFWRSVWEGHKRDRLRRGHATQAEAYWSRDAAGEVHRLMHEPARPTWWERAVAPLACGCTVAALMFAAGMFGFLAALGVSR